MDFEGAVAEAAMVPEFVKEYNRITGNNFGFSPPRSGIEAMIDKSVGFKGFNEGETRKFAAFVYEYVWSRLPDECFTESQPSKPNTA